MKTVLVTGGAGFIGNALVRRLLQNEAVGSGTLYRVVNLDLLTYAGNLDSLADVIDHPRHVFVKGDINDRQLVERLLSQFDVSGVLHLAAESHVDRSIDAPAQFVLTNAVGTFELLQAARKHWLTLDEASQQAFRFLHVSTDEVFGSLGDEGCFHPEFPYHPSSPYSASKAASDHFVRAYFHTYNLPTLITNCTNNYGPRQFPEKLIPLMIEKAISGEPLPVYGDGLNVRDWLFVDDHCEALVAVFERGLSGETYTIGGEAERTNLQVVETICRVVDQLRPRADGKPRLTQRTFVPDRPGHDRRYAMDISKIRHELSWQPRHSFDRGIEETVAWYLENRGWVERIASGSYRGERLGRLS
jgi:dTDP-glucose 4,6-dehydratase